MSLKYYSREMQSKVRKIENKNTGVHFGVNLLAGLDLSSVADPGCFIEDPTIFSSRIRFPTFFHPGSHMKSGMQT
jgi:hypothetical protein